MIYSTMTSFISIQNAKLILSYEAMGIQPTAVDAPVTE